MKWRPKVSIEKGVNILMKIKLLKKCTTLEPKKIKVATKLWFRYLS